MKKIIFTLFVLTTAHFVHAQQDTVWRRGGLIALNFSQVSLTNWAAGGQNSVSGNSIVNYFANYKRGKYSWDSNVDLGYGLIIQGKNGRVEKSDDKLEFASKYGRQASAHWYYSALLNFRSQFTPGYNLPNDTVVTSKFFAPAYITLALGMDYKPNDEFSLFLSPAALRFIFVSDTVLSPVYGVDPGKTLLVEAGAYVKVAYKKDISTSVNFQSTLGLFSNYIKNPQNIEVNGQALLTLKVSKVIAASISAQVIYDDKTKLVFYKEDNATIDHIGPGTQFKEVIGVGLAYKFSGFSVR